MLYTQDLDALYTAFIFAPKGEAVQRAGAVAAALLDAQEGSTEDAPVSIRPTMCAPTAAPKVR